MKKLLALFLLLSPAAFAGYQNCPKGWVDANPRAYKLLKSLEGTHKLGSCQFEIHSCDDSQSEGSDSMVGDMMITYMHQPTYIPLYVGQNGANSMSQLEVHENSLFYRFSDQNNDPYAGDNELAGIRFIFNESNGILTKIVVKQRTRQDSMQVLFWTLPKTITCVSGM